MTSTNATLHFDKNRHKRELASSTRSVRDARLSAPGLRATLAAAAGASRANRDVLASSVKDALLTYVCHRATPAWLTPPAARSVDDCLRHEARVSAGGAHLAMASLLKARGLLGRSVFRFLCRVVCR